MTGIVSDTQSLDTLAIIQRTFVDMLSDKMKTEQAAAFRNFTSERSIAGNTLVTDFFSNLPTMEEWVGEAKYSSLRSNLISIAVKPYSKATAIPLVQLYGDETGQVMKALNNVIAQGVADKDRLATQQLLAGLGTDTNSLGGDGVSFFSTSHPNGNLGALWSNLGTSKLSVSAFNTARTAMLNLKDENGEPWNINPNILMVAPKNERLAREILQTKARMQSVDSSGGVDTASSVVGGAAVENVMSLYGMSVVVNKRLSDEQWFLFDSTNPQASAIIMGILKDLTPETNVEQYKETPDARFAVRFYAAIGFGAPHLAWGSTGTT